MYQIPIRIVNESKFPLPEYKTPLSAGCDLLANVEEPIYVGSHSRVTVPTGIHIELPDGYEAQVRGRSGLNFKKDITVHTGTIDADYRGEIAVRLSNESDEPFLIEPGDRIAQLVISPVIQATWLVCDSLDETERGVGGFGSTGLK